MQPKVSIIIPVFNVEAYLEQCFDSAVKQSFESFEIIIINDGSTDNSLRICERYAQEYANIKLISQENQGLSAARNAGIRVASGEYLTFLDSDDFLHPDFCRIMYNVAQANEALLVGCYTAHVPENGIVIKDWIVKQESAKHYSAEEIIVSDCRKAKGLAFYEFAAWGKFYDRALFKSDDKCFPVGVHFEDCCLALRNYIDAGGIYLVDNVLMYYRKRADSIMGNMLLRPEVLLDYYVQFSETLSIVSSQENFEAMTIVHFYNKIRKDLVKQYNQYQLLIYEAKILNEEYDTNKRYALFGAGNHGRKYRGYFFSKHTPDQLVFIDNNDNYVGTTIKGTRVISLEEYKRSYTDYELIVTSIYCDEIIFQLMHSGIISTVATLLPNKGRTGVERALSKGMQYFIDTAHRCGIYKKGEQ